VAGEIQGHVWCDFDGDGQRDAADPQVVEQKVFLDANRNGVLDAGEVSTTTDSEGFYAFRNLSSGTYRVRVAWWVSSWRPTYHGDGADVVLAAGQVIPSVDFGAQFTAPMEVNVWAEDDAAAEPNDNAYFSLYVPTHGPFPLTINVQIAGTAAPGVDYQLSGTSGNTITIPPRTCIATVLLYALNDLVAEDLEYVTVTVLPGDGYSLGSSVQDTITIADDQGGPKRLYVDAEATGGNIGTSWHDAFVDLRAALLAAVPGDEVWVAEGTYVPGPDRVDCFEIKKGMTVYGGFAGTETHRDQRDWRSHPTVLSGDIGVRGDNADNSYRLVHLWDVGDDVVVDGFTIADANGYDGPFGGYSEGALAATAGSSPVLRNLTFIGNRASEGGAIAFNSCSRANNPIVENCVFLNNVAKYVGGAIFSIGTATPHIRNSVFVGNRSDRDGGAVWGHNYPLELTNCVFVNNSAVNGGALYSYDRNRPTVTNCTFVGNHASQKGGAIYHQDTSLAVVNSVLWGNVDAGGSDESAQIHTESGSVAVSYSCVQGWTGGLGGAGNLGSEPRLYNVTDPAGPDGVFFTLDDGLTLRRGSPCIDAADGTAAPATDLRGQTRYDDAATPNTGAGTIPYADRGAYEFTGFVPPPAISNIMDQTTLEDITRGPIAFTVSGVETPAGSITATSDNQALIPNPNLVLGGSGTHRTLTLTPAANQFGTATITVTVSDGTATASDTFLFTVTPVNDVPTISDITNQATFEDTAAGPLTVTIGDVELPADALTVTATSNNQTLIPNANLVLGGSGANRTLTLTPAANRFGTATITVTVSDGTATASETFVLTVSAVNDLPTISDLTDRSIPEDGSTGAIGFRVSDVETAASALTVTATSDNQTLVPNASLIRGGSGTNRTLSARPAANQFGTATITVTVRDADGGTAVDTLVLTVTPVNDRPTISDITNKSVAEDTPTPAIGFTVSDLETPPDSLTVTAVSSNATLVPAGNITLGGSGASRTIRLTPARDQFGTSTITVTVRDADGATAVDTFVLTVSSVNDFPTVSDIANRSITMGSNTGNIPFTVGDVETAAASLRVTVASSNTVLVPTANIALGGSGANRTIRVTPVVNRTGTATITVTVRDANNATSQDQFVLTVTRSGAATLTSTAALAAMGPTSRATTAHTGAAGDRVTVLSAPSATLPAAAAAPRGRPAPSVSSIDANRVPASVVTSKAELPDDLLSVLARDAAAALPANSAADRLFATLATGTVQ
jgi:predicted outer membrane repeat protein